MVHFIWRVLTLPSLISSCRFFPLGRMRSFLFGKVGNTNTSTDTGLIFVNFFILFAGRATHYCSGSNAAPSCFTGICLLAGYSSASFFAHGPDGFLIRFIVPSALEVIFSDYVKTGTMLIINLHTTSPPTSTRSYISLCMIQGL